MSGRITAVADAAAAGASGEAAVSDPLWDDWDTPPRVPDMPELHLPGFDGPIGLLLDLAERQRIDLGLISILQLAEQFVAAMERLQRHVTLERRADWLVMAARLVLLRSRLLFPANPESEVEATLDAERESRRLDRMVFVRAAATWLERRLQLGRDVFARPHGRSPRVVSYMALMEACLVMLRGPEGQPGVEEAIYRPASATLFRVDEAMARIRALLAEPQHEVAFERCLPTIGADDPQRTLKARSAVASSLVAVLELARGGEVTIAQAEPHAAILLTSKAQPAES